MFSSNVTCVRRNVVAMCFAMLICLACSSHGALVYEIDFERDTYRVDVDDTIDVVLLFREIRTDTDIAKLAIGDNDGMFAVGLTLDFQMRDPTVAAGVAIDSFMLNDDANGFDPAFTTNSMTADANTSRRFQLNAQSRDFTSGIEVVSFNDVRGDVFEIEIGTIRLKNLGPQGAITTLTLESSGVPFENAFTDATVPPQINFGMATLGSTAVPEPSPLPLICLAVLPILLHRRFSRRPLSLRLGERVGLAKRYDQTR